jgi:hypothetical protein
MCAAEDVHEGEGRPGRWRDAVLGAEREHLVMADQAALVRDVVADQRDAVVAREEQGAVAGLEEPAARVVLHQGRQP